MITDRLHIGGRTIVITGAAGAIGSTVALAVAEAGATAVLIDVDLRRLDELAARLHDQGYPAIAIAGPIDLTPASKSSTPSPSRTK